MEWFLLTLLVPVGLIVWVLATRRRRTTLPLDPRDRAELDAVGAALLAEHRAASVPGLRRRLTVLSRRGVPLASVEPTGVEGQWLMRFADETPLLVRERRRGDGALLGVRLAMGRVTLGAHELADTGVVVELRWRGGRVRLLAVA